MESMYCKCVSRSESATMRALDKQTPMCQRRAQHARHKPPQNKLEGSSRPRPQFFLEQSQVLAPPSEQLVDPLASLETRHINEGGERDLVDREGRKPLAF